MKQPSGKFVIRMPRSLHGRLKLEAMRTGQSLNQLCVAKLDAGGQPIAGLGGAPSHAGLFPTDLMEKIVRRWRSDLVGLVLFGSAARGDATDESDVDLLLVMKPDVRIARDLYRRWDELCRECGARDPDRISPHFVRLPRSVGEAGGLWYETALEGISLWERDRQVSRFLRSVREAMGQGKIRRRMLHGSPYWIKEIKESNAQ
jgi:predicted nucleotidyltransferase